MSLAKRLYELQQVELSIQGRQKSLEEIEAQLARNEAYEKAKSDLAGAEKEQAALEKQYKELDYEAEELRSNIHQINNKLYGGKIKNPKELLGYEQENESLKARLSKKDDVLLELMDKIEAGKSRIAALRQEFKTAEAEFNRLKDELSDRRDKEKQDLAGQERKRQEMNASLEKPVLSNYQGIRARKGQAVVKVEQGRCLGCRVTLSVSELQRVRGAGLVTCSNCGRILYLS